MPAGPTRCCTDGALGRPQVAVCETLWYRPDSYFLPDWRGNWAGEGGGPTLGHGIHQIDLLLHLMGPWTSVQAQSSRLARPVEFEDVSLAMITFASGAVGTIVTSLLSPARAQPDPDRHHERDAGGRSPVRLPRRRLVLEPRPGRLDRGPATGATRASGPTVDPTAPVDDVWGDSRSVDVPSNHAAQINRLVDDLLAGRPHETTLSAVRPTMELVTALYASSLTGATVHRRDLVPGIPTTPASTAA